MWIRNILENNKKTLALAPMADMTDSAFCQVVRSIGGADVVFREMVSAEAVVRENVKTLGMVNFVASERPIIQQIFGADPDVMARAAALIMEQTSPEGIDINMGCPVYKITSNFNGCALMKEPERAASIIRAIKKEIGDTPLSVKIRLGWSNPDDFKTFIPVLEEAGVDLITVHGRTKAQGYSGVSDWGRIGEAKALATVPLLANGDIHESSQVAEALKITKADGVLIARGALGNPWFFAQALDVSRIVTPEERVQIILQHVGLHIGQYGDRGITTFRKHLAWYFKNNRLGVEIPGIKELRGRLMRVSSLEELRGLLGEYLEMEKSVLVR